MCAKCDRVEAVVREKLEEAKAILMLEQPESVNDTDHPVSVFGLTVLELSTEQLTKDALAAGKGAREIVEVLGGIITERTMKTTIRTLLKSQGVDPENVDDDKIIETMTRLFGPPMVVGGEEDGERDSILAGASGRTIDC